MCLWSARSRLRRASALGGQVLATSFSTWDIFRTLVFKSRYQMLIEQGLCGGANMLPNFWRLRNQFNVRLCLLDLGVI